MSALGLVALLLAAACCIVLIYDLRLRRTAFAQFAAGRASRPTVFWLGIAGWGACLAGSLLVALADHDRQACDGRMPCAAKMEGR